MFKGTIFDLDGVIVDTVPIHFKAWQNMFKEYGIDFNFDDYKAKVDGIPRLDGARAILTDLSPDELEKAASKKQGYFLELINSMDVPVHQSTVELIKELKHAGKKIAVASSSRNCRRILEKTKLINLADTVVEGSDFEKGKPAPDIFLLAAQKLALNSEECIVFEDASLGVEAAKNGKMRCVGVDRYNDPARLSKADIIVKDLSEITYKNLEELFNQ